MTPGTPPPVADGPRWPAEWEPHEATWIAWPHHARDWPGKLAPVRWAFVEMVRLLAEHETVRLIVEDDKSHRQALGMLRRAGAPEGRVEFFRIPTDRAWTRDYGWFFLRGGPDPNGAIVDFEFTGWGKYPNHARDNRVPRQVARKLGLRRIEPRAAGRPVVLEGGAVDGNGAGTLLTTEECLLDRDVQPRNPHLGREALETAMCAALGARHVIWLGRGIAGDDTHGHVDDLARFVGPRTILLAEQPDAADPDHLPLEENRERLEQARLADGSRPEVIRLPMPSPLVFEGLRLPASYANFYVANEIVLAPTFNDPRDRAALGILAECFPGRAVRGVHAVDLVWGFGTLHCLTQQQTAR